MDRLLGERYQVVHPLWRDRLGETFVALDRARGVPVVARLLRGPLAGPATAHRFARERHRLTAIRDPHLAAVLDLTRDGDELVIVSEAVEGYTLRHHLRSGTPSTAESARIGAGVAAALAALHAGGVVHQHVHPDKIVLGPDGRARLTDVALAHLLDPNPAAREHLRGADPAPELRAGADPSPASDVYALGTLLDRLAPRRPSPLRRVVRGLRSPDPRARPTAHQARVRLAPRDTGQDEDSAGRLGRTGLATLR